MYKVKIVEIAGNASEFTVNEPHRFIFNKTNFDYDFRHQVYCNLGTQDIYYSIDEIEKFPCVFDPVSFAVDVLTLTDLIMLPKNKYFISPDYLGELAAKKYPEFAKIGGGVTLDILPLEKIYLQILVERNEK